LIPLRHAGPRPGDFVMASATCGGSGQAAGAWRRRVTSAAAEETALAEFLAAAEPATSRSLGEAHRTSWGSGSSSSGSRPGISGRRRIAADSRDLLRFAARTRGFRLRGSSRRARRRPRLRGGGARPRCVAAIVERPISGLAVPQSSSTAARPPWPWLRRVVRRPEPRARIVGITGTDGKTTTSFLATAMLESARHLDGSADHRPDQAGELRSANPEHVTTPEAPQLQLTLRAMSTPAIRPLSSRPPPTVWPWSASTRSPTTLPCSPT